MNLKYKKIIVIFLVFLALISFQSCCFYGDCNDWLAEPINSFIPIILNRAEFKAFVKILPSEKFVKSKKIYIKDNEMLVNDVNKGFHIYNYSDATNPVKIAFLRILGATAVAIRNSIIYINQAADLVTLKYNLPTNKVTVLCRNKDIFPQKFLLKVLVITFKDNGIITLWILK